MKNLREITITAFITVILILIIAFCICGTVFGRDKGASWVKAGYYQSMEQEYVQEIRSLLEEKGYCNSGVTMNRVIEEDGTRQYTVTIHHRRIAALNHDQQEQLIEECRSIFCHKFFETDL